MGNDFISVLSKRKEIYQIVDRGPWYWGRCNGSLSLSILVPDHIADMVEIRLRALGFRPLGVQDPDHHLEIYPKTHFFITNPFSLSVLVWAHAIVARSAQWQRLEKNEWIAKPRNEADLSKLHLVAKTLPFFGIKAESFLEAQKREKAKEKPSLKIVEKDSVEKLLRLLSISPTGKRYPLKSKMRLIQELADAMAAECPKIEFSEGYKGDDEVQTLLQRVRPAEVHEHNFDEVDINLGMSPNQRRNEKSLCYSCA